MAGEHLVFISPDIATRMRKRAQGEPGNPRASGKIGLGRVLCYELTCSALPSIVANEIIISFYKLNRGSHSIIPYYSVHLVRLLACAFWP
jgi:hypothetical protein